MADLIRWRVNLPCGSRPELGPGWTDLTIRAGTSDEQVIDEIWVHDVYHLRGLDLGEKPLIVDLGANIGAFTCAALTQWPDAHVIAVEPDAENMRLFHQNVAPYRSRIDQLHAAVGATSGGLLFLHGEQGTAHTERTGPTPVDAYSLNDILSDRHVALLKCDIEGGEYDALIGADLSNVDHIALEWHGPDTAAHLDDDGGVRYGQLCAWLARTHAVQTFGRPDAGGMIFAHRYDQ